MMKYLMMKSKNKVVDDDPILLDDPVLNLTQGTRQHVRHSEQYSTIPRQV